MSKHTIKGYITYHKYNWSDTPVIQFCPWKPTEDHETAIVRAHSLEVEIPDDFNPVPLMVAGLEEKKRLARVRLADELREIDEQMSKLLCIESKPSEPDSLPAGEVF